MSYLRDKKLRRNLKISTVVMLVVVVLYFFSGAISVFTSRIIMSVAVPVLRVGSKIHNIVADGKFFLSSKNELYKENENLKNKLETMNMHLLGIGELYKENEDLKNILGRSVNKDIILSAVLSKPPVSPYDTLIIDIGKRLGVKKGDLVMVDGDIAIGSVSDVFVNSSKVELFSAPGRRTDVLIGQDNVSISATGMGGGNFEIKMPRDIPVSTGDIISVSGLNIKILGVVKYIENEPSNPFKTILFENPVNMNNLKWIQVVI